jgi:hypothetical protein
MLNILSETMLNILRGEKPCGLKSGKRRKEGKAVITGTTMIHTKRGLFPNYPMRTCPVLEPD